MRKKCEKILLLFMILICSSTIKAQTITVDFQETKSYEGESNKARIDFLSRNPDLIFVEGNGEDVVGPQKVDGGMYLYTCICDTRDTHSFGFEIRMKGSEQQKQHNVSIKKGELKVFTVDVKDASMTISDIKVDKESLPVREENMARAVVVCKSSLLIVKSNTGEVVKGPEKRTDDLFEYTVYFNLSKKESREKERVLSFSVDNEDFQEYSIGKLSPKQGLEIIVVVVPAAKYLSYKLSAEQYQSNGQYSEAIEAYMEAQKSSDKPKDLDFTDQITKMTRNLMSLNKANNLFMEEKWKEARQVYNDLLADNPGDYFVAQKIKDCDVKLEPPKAFPPTVSTGTVTNVKTNSFVGSGNVDNTGGLPVSSRGICWSVLKQEPTIDDDKVIVDGELGDFSGEATGLLPNRLYYVRSFAQNSAGVAYGKVITATTTKGKPWISMPTSFKHDLIDLKLYEPDITFSNSQNVYFFHMYSNSAIKYNIQTNTWRKITGIPNNIRNWNDYYLMCKEAPTINNVAYTVIEGGANKTFAIIRYDMTVDAFLPIIDTSIKKEQGAFLQLQALCGFALNDCCYFLLNNKCMIEYNTTTNQHRYIRTALNAKWLADCTAFSIDNKGYVVYKSGYVEEYDPVKNIWIEKNNVPEALGDSNGKPLFGFAIHKKGYVWSIKNRKQILYEYNPKIDAWKECSTPASQDSYITTFASVAGNNFGLIGYSSRDSEYNHVWRYYLYDPMQENF